MRQVLAIAIRLDQKIHVTIHGYLRNSYWEAVITGLYPGNIVHATDPGRAEVYIGEVETPGSLFSVQRPIPWSATVNILDPKYDEVAIFVNKHEIGRVPVKPAPRQFEVYALNGSDHLGSVIMPVGHGMKWGYHPVYGPASHDACVQWVNEHVLRFY